MILANELRGGRVAILAAHEGVEQVEMAEPRKAVESAGAEVGPISDRSGEIRRFNYLDEGDTSGVDHRVSEVSADDYDALIPPGVVANPDILRTVPEAVSFAERLFEQEKPVGVIRHGPRTLVGADAPRGRTDIENAGGEWVDEEVHADKGPVSSHNPDDLPAFCDRIVEESAEGKRPELARSA